MARAPFATLLLISCTIHAQDVSKAHFVRASGEATITAAPDRAQLSIAVTTRAATAQAASSQNASETARVIEALKHTLGRSGEVKTTGYSVSPQYKYAPGHSPELIGYETTNTVLVTTDELSSVGNIIDAATASGANTINGVSYTLRDDSEVRAKALSEATLKAKSNAEAIARALGVHVVGVLQAEPTQLPIVRPLPMQAMKASPMAEPAATPIEAGNLDIHATVTVVLEIQ
ncbi:MAG: SIMPL domain-containing protein [Acidobacteriaceae bacterium]|nr:SIMPL domain-containing protein [Acidobacteriaceae bacterium]